MIAQPAGAEPGKRAARYPAIEHHGLIGDLRTAALVSVEGVTDFFCPLRFDRPTLFASLLDERPGGSCSVRPVGTGYHCQQIYLLDTNVLTTSFLAPDGVAELVDFMPIDGGPDESTIVRRVRVTRGRVTLRFECTPAFGYASVRHDVVEVRSGAVFAADGEGFLIVESDRPVSTGGGTALAEVTLTAGERATFVLTFVRTNPGAIRCRPAAAERTLQETVRFWRGWVAECRYRGRWQEMVIRSALVLKLLTYEPSGAIVAAPTFGLPEAIGGGRNWDYRYTWLRDAAMTQNAFTQLGYRHETAQFRAWLKRVASTAEFRGELQIMDGVEGETDLAEREISTLAGYRGSQPVRIGNAAHSQVQLDVYGALFRAALLEVNAGVMIEYDRWKTMRAVINSLSRSWRTADHGIWEIRGERRAFLHSRLMCWVAFDRAIRIAQTRSLPAPLHTWLETRDQIYESIHDEFWDERLGSFVQYQGSSSLDASVLQMPLLDFISPDDPRWIGTLAAIGSRLTDDASVARYDAATGVDGLAGGEGDFTACSFWYVEALAVSGEVEHARMTFEKILGYANHLGLYAEELGPGGEHLGNFPQALTHLALIQCALTLNDALDRASHGQRTDIRIA